MATTDSSILLYAIPGVEAYQIENGQERLVTPNSFQTLSLYLVPTSPTSHSSSSSVSEKFISELKFVLPPELDFTISAATASAYFQYPRSYLIIRKDALSKGSSILRIDFPSDENKKTSTKDDIETFESILAQCNIMTERGPSSIQQYEPLLHMSGKSATPHDHEHNGQIVLVDEDNGNVIGELGSGFQLVENAQMKPGINGPVEITLPTDASGKISVGPASQSHLDLAMHPAYKDSTLVSKASMASQLIITTSGYVCKALNSQADAFTQKTKPNIKPLSFEPTTHARIRKVRYLTDGAVGLSAKTVGQVQKYAQNFGATVSHRDKTQAKNGTVKPDAKPGLINKSVVAFSTIADGIDQAGRNLLTGTGTAMTKVIGHKYGPEAGEITKHIGSGVRNVGLVYIDATGVSRRALIKSVAKGMVIGRAPGGGNLVVGSNEAVDDKDSKTNGDTFTSSFHVATNQVNGQNQGNKYNQHQSNSTPQIAAGSTSRFDRSSFDIKPPPPYSSNTAGNS